MALNITAKRRDYDRPGPFCPQGLRENSARLRDMVDQLQTFLEKLSPATEKAVPYVREAEIHSHKLQQQARECQTILNSTQQTSSSALAYDEIAKIIDEAQNISEAALATSNEAHDNEICGDPVEIQWLTRLSFEPVWSQVPFSSSLQGADRWDL
ncbi:uncharacterized protein LOC121834146 [Ixodes scapularis]|uniref:uncharacterized protein LOC121834146 n=1 Tax=Ixodes scapularis TaxID=6945 RepID=UPI001C38CC5D|nr:uncharacterized protein LOC121834146 [Ixodes scapularis]